MGCRRPLTLCRRSALHKVYCAWDLPQTQAPPSTAEGIAAPPPPPRSASVSTGARSRCPTFPRASPVVAGQGNPLVRGGNIAFVPNSQVEDPQWTPGSHNQWDFTIQRELPGHSRVEVGYVSHTARNIYQ